MESRSETMPAKIDAYESLLNQMLIEIRHIIIYRDLSHSMYGEHAVLESLDALLSLEPYNACTLLFSVHEEDGWRYASMLASIKNQEIIEKYIQLLKGIAADEKTNGKLLLELLSLMGAHNKIFGRLANAKNKQDYLSVLSGLSSREGEDNQVEVSAIQALLKTPDNLQQTFLHDVRHYLFAPLKREKAERPQYCALFCFMLENNLIASEDYSLFAHCKPIIADYIQQKLCGDEKIQMLEKALNPESPLGQFFQPDEAKLLPKFKVLLDKLSPVKVVSPVSSTLVPDISESEDLPLPERHPKRGWFSFLSSSKAKSKPKEQEDIPLEMLTPQLRSSGPSKSG